MQRRTVNLYECLFVCVDAHAYEGVFIYVCVCMSAFKCACLHLSVCTYVCVCVYVRVCVYSRRTHVRACVLCVFV